VYVYDGLGNELERFKDIKYAYVSMFSPNNNVFLVKSTDGNIAVYSLYAMKLLKKFRFSKVAASQDDGFCFSKDGKLFYNIERHINSCNSCLSIYETSSFSRTKQLFLSEPFELSHIEYDDICDGLYLIGFMRDETGVYDCGFVASFMGDNLTNITRITRERYDYITGYKRLEIMGFTQKSKKWSSLFYQGYDLEKLVSVKLSDVVCVV